MNSYSQLGNLIFHQHKYTRIPGNEDLPDYFECECGNQIDESGATDYQLYLESLENLATEV